MGLMLRWINNRDGATAIEYGLIAAGISIAILLAVNTFGENLYNLFYQDLPGALGGE